MPNAHYNGDVSLYSLATLNMLALFEDVTYTIEETQVDGAALTRDGASPNGTKLAAKITTNLLSTTTVPDRVSHLHLSGLTVGGNSYLASVKSVEMSGSFTQKARAGVGAWFKRPQNVAKDYSATIELDCDDDVASAFMIKAHSTTHADRDMALSMTLNGNAVTAGMRLQTVEFGVKRDDLQTLKLTLKGKDPGSGNFPASPTGTSSLLEKALNAWKTAIGFSFASHSSAGFQVDGNAIFSSFSFRIEDEQLVKNTYSFDSFGTVTAVATDAGP